MVKLNIPPTPYNYGVWYHYVSNRDTQLNTLVDQTIRKLGGIPHFLAKEFFHEFVADDDKKFDDDKKTQIEKIISTVGTSSQEMEKSIKDLNHVLKNSQKVLKSSKGDKQLEKVVSYLEKGTEKASQESEKFLAKLNEAQAEMAELKKALEDAKSDVELDPVTKLHNQKGLERHIFSWLPGAEDDLSLFLLDIDHLDKINKDHGKQVGNQLIRFLANFLKGKKFENTLIARVNGGTFAILMNEATLGFSSQFAEKLRSHIEGQTLRHKETKKVLCRFTVSIGVATSLGDESADSLLARAKKHLKEAKKMGRNSTVSH
ncbi:GGDEF family protein [Marinomonas sp. MED121]|nr:GGDEF family protein [Marinomonas sp. MED121]